MVSLEAKAFNYFTIIEDEWIKSRRFGLDPTLFHEYLELCYQITGHRIPFRKGCTNRVRRAHTYFSDYFKQKNII